MATIGQLSEFQPETEKASAYLERVKLFLLANSVGDDKQVAVLLTVIGARHFSLLKDLFLPEDVKAKSFEQISKVLVEHFEPKPLVIAERFRFYRRTQEEEESVTEFMAQLRRLATHCQFGAFLEEALRDRLVCGLRNHSIQRRLLSESNLSLQKAVEISTGMEAAELNSKTISTSSVTEEVKQVSLSTSTSVNGPKKKPVCFRCGGPHLATSCHHQKAQCHKCGKIGHLARVCRGAQVPRHRQAPKSADTQWVEDDIDQSQNVLVVGLKNSCPFCVELGIEGRRVQFDIDTGSAVTLVSERTWKKLNLDVKLRNSRVLLRTYTGDPISVVGEAKVAVSYNQQLSTLVLYVVKGTGPSLLGRDWLRHIKLDWKTVGQVASVNRVTMLDSLLKRYHEVFQGGLGTLKGVHARLQVKPNAVPKFFKARTVPFALREAVEKELDRLEQEGVIKKVDHSEWAAPIVVVPKGDGQIRICGDYKVTVNGVLDVDQYPLPKPEDLFASLVGGQKFSKLDLSQAYQQMCLDEESQKFVTINTHKGLYRYTRLPFGVASAPALFQKTMDVILQGMKHVMCYIDDILVTGSTEMEHFIQLEEVLKRLQHHGLKVKKDKCALFQDSVQYLGHKIDVSGIHTTDSKVEAVKNAPAPKNVQELRSFLGLLHYYGRFIQQLSTLLQPLNELLKSNRRWEWTSECQSAFVKAIERLVSAPVLAHYDPSLPLKLAGDASAYGIGAVISHTYQDGQERPIAFASRTLSAAELSYSQIEKESLSLVYGVKKFHQYLYGRKFVLVTDHKPLVTLLGPTSGIPTLAAARLQRWALILSAYSYDLEFRPTQRHSNADGLSRLPVVSKDRDDSSDVPETAIFNISQVHSLPVTAMQLQRATRRDPILSKVLLLMQQGWPGVVSDDLKPYQSRQAELGTEGGCILWGIRVVVPQALQSKVLGELHKNHPGVVRMKALARSYVWWPGLDNDIEHHVKNCQPCQTVRNSPPSAPLHPWLWPTRPWQRVHVDFAGPFQGKMFLLVVDAHSKWPEVVSMTTTSAQCTIEELRRMFASYGIPEQLVSDNGPQFVSGCFEEFMKMNGVKHIKCTPYHPSSNGAVERLVQTFKNFMKVNASNGGTLSQHLASFLFSYRTTPHATTNVAPCELFLGRKIRSRLDLLRPDVESRVNEQQAKQKACHDGNSPFREFFLGQNVMSRNLRNGPDWVPGVIVERLGPLTYLVQVSSGAFWKRHVDQLRTSVDDQVEMPCESGDPLLLPETYMPPVIESTNEGSATLQPMNEHQPPCPSVSKPPQEVTSNLPASSTVPVELPAIQTDLHNGVNAGSNTSIQNPEQRRYPTRIRKPPQRL